MPSLSTRHSGAQDSGTGLVIPLAVGLGVGVPCLATVILLSWLFVRHRRISREEDKQNENIDIDGDLTLYESQIVDEKQIRPKIHRDDSSSLIYTPYISNPSLQSVDGFSRSMTSVLGPSPFHPSSTEALRVNRSFSNTSSFQYQPPPPVMPSQPWSDRASSTLSSHVSSHMSSHMSSPQSSFRDLHSLASSERESDADLSYSPTRRGSPLEAHFDDPEFRRLSTVSRNRTPPLTNSAQSSRASLDAHRATFDYSGDEHDDPRMSIVSDISLRTAQSGPRQFLSANPQFSDSKSSLAHSALAHEIVPDDYSNDMDSDSDDFYSNETSRQTSRQTSRRPSITATLPEVHQETVAMPETEYQPHFVEPHADIFKKEAVEQFGEQVKESVEQAAQVAQVEQGELGEKVEQAEPIESLEQSEQAEQAEQAEPIESLEQSEQAEQAEQREPAAHEPIAALDSKTKLTEHNEVEQHQPNIEAEQIASENELFEPEAEPDAEPDVDPEVEPEVEPEAKPEVEPEAEPEAKPEVEPKAEPAEQDFDFSNRPTPPRPRNSVVLINKQLPTPEGTPVPERTATTLISPSVDRPTQAPPVGLGLTPDNSQEMDTSSMEPQLYPQRPPSPAFSLAASSMYAESSVYPESSISNRFVPSNPGSPRQQSMGSFKSPPPNFTPAFSDYMELPDVPVSGSFSPRSSRRLHTAPHSSPKMRPPVPAPRNSVQVHLDESVFLEPKRKFGAKNRGKASPYPAHGMH